jgi:hypothetical protein
MRADSDVSSSSSAGPARVLVVPVGPTRYALPLATVSEVTELDALRRVPLAPEWVLGLVGRRGRIVIVLDLARILGHAAFPEPRCLVRLGAPLDHLGLAVPAAPRLVPVARVPDGISVPNRLRDDEGDLVPLDPIELLGVPGTATFTAPCPE